MTFEEFARSRLDPLLRFAKVLCVDRGLAEDVVQEVLLRAHGRWDHIGGLDMPEVYVRRMIVNEFLSWRRKWSRILPTDVLPDVARVADPADSHADRAFLLQQLSMLPRRQRVALVLRYYGGLSDTEIAADFGCSVSAVRSYISRALATLRVDVQTPQSMSIEGVSNAD